MPRLFFYASAPATIPEKWFLRRRGAKKKNPRWKSGGPNQKPLTIKPYPMKIHC